MGWKWYITTCKVCGKEAKKRAKSAVAEAGRIFGEQINRIEGKEIKADYSPRVKYICDTS